MNRQVVSENWTSRFTWWQMMNGSSVCGKLVNGIKITPLLSTPSDHLFCVFSPKDKPYIVSPFPLLFLFLNKLIMSLYSLERRGLCVS